LTEFRDRTYTFGAIADEYYIPELRASVMNSLTRRVLKKSPFQHDI